MSRSIDLISCCFEEISALGWVKEIADVLESVADGVEGSSSLLSQQGFEFREGHLDGVEIGGVGRQGEQPGAALAHQFGGALAFVERHVVEDDDIAR